MGTEPEVTLFAVAVALGGTDDHTLFLCSADTDLPRLARGETTGRIDYVKVDHGRSQVGQAQRPRVGGRQTGRGLAGRPARER